MSATPTVESGGFKTFAATGNLSSSPVAMRGILISAASGTPTIAVYDDTGTGTTVPIVQTMTPVAGQFIEIPAMTNNGLYVVISGTVQGTAFFDPQTLLGGGV
jgi:hypothetical protein